MRREPSGRGRPGGRRTALALLLCLGGAGCQGMVTEPGVELAQGAQCDASDLLVPDAPARRLSHPEYRRTLRDLFPGVEIEPEQLDLIPDTKRHGFENATSALTPNPVLIEQYDAIAADVARRVTRSDARGEVLGCWPERGADAAAEQACGHQIIRTLGRRAFRRPLADDEAQRYGDFFDQHLLTHEDFVVAVRLTLQAMLQAPQLLYRIERGDPDETDGELVALTDHELATRLAYFLWASTPDEALLAAADAGELSDPEALEAHVRRMLDDPRATEALVDYHRQWLDFDRVDDSNKDSERFPEFDAELRDAMREEQDRFIAHVITDGDGTLASLFLDRTTFVNDRLADLYGVEPPAGEGWERRELPADERAGILTRAAFLTSHAHQRNGSPPLRGVFVIDRLLCGELEAPPADADTSNPVAEDDGPQTNRALFEARTSGPACWGCHQSIDGIGFGFEAYDAVGAYRVEDNGQPVDTSGWFYDTDVDGPFSDPVAMAERLAESAQVQRCAVRNVYRYAYGRDETASERCEVDALADAFADGGGDLRELMATLALRPEFRYRRLDGGAP